MTGDKWRNRAEKERGRLYIIQAPDPLLWIVETPNAFLSGVLDSFPRVLYFSVYHIVECCHIDISCHINRPTGKFTMADNSGRVTDTPQLEKPEVAQAEFTGDHHHHVGSKKDEIDQIDAMALGSGLTKASFAHLDEAKILRKVMSTLARHEGLSLSLTISLVDGHAPSPHAGPLIPVVLPGSRQ